MQKISKIVLRFSLKQRIQLTAIVFLSLFLCVSTASLFLLSSNYKKLLSESLYENLLYSSDQLYKNLNQVQNLADTILADAIIQEELPLCRDNSLSQAEQRHHRTNVYNSISSHLMNYGIPFISYLSILQDDTTISSFFRGIPIQFYLQFEEN